jgi:phage-related protein
VDDRPDKPLVWLHGRVASPPMGVAARIETGKLLRKLQSGETLSMPESRPMPMIGPRCHELRIVDRDVSWRLVYRTDSNAIVIAEVFRKSTKVTPQSVIERCRRRLAMYDRLIGG